MFGLGGNSAAISLDLDPGWSIGAMFGGALLREAARAACTAVAPADWIAVEVSARFLRPMRPGAAVAQVEVLHSGRRTRVAAVQLVQDGRVGVAALLTLAPEASVPLALSAEPADLPDAGSAPTGPGAGVPAQVDWRVVGDWGPQQGPLRAWITPRGASAPPVADWCLVAADLLVPALPDARRDRPVRFASLSIDVSLLARPGGTWLLQEVEAASAGDAAHATMRLAAPTGELVARVLHRGVLLPADQQEMPYCATAFGAGVPDAGHR